MTDDGIDKVFWGVVMRPEKRYEQTVEVGFHLSKAVLDPNTAKSGWTTVTVENDGEEIIICALNEKTLSSDLDLNFMQGETVCFQVNGAGTVHMSGYLMSGDDDSMMDFDASSEDESESEEVPALVNGDLGGKKNKRKLEDSLTEASAEKKKAKLTPLDKALAKKEKEEAVKNAKEASKNLKKEVKKAEKKKEEDDDDDDESDDDDDEEGDDDDGDDDSGDDDNEEEEDDDDSDDDDDDEEEEDSSSKDVSMNSTADSTPKKQEKNKKKKEQQLNGGTPTSEKKKKKENDENATPNKKAKDEQPSSPKKTPKNEKKKGENTPAKTPTRTVKGGIKIQDMVEGTGPVAGHKKTIGMFYEGRLAKNGKKFDGNFGGKPFKFKLGMGEVIKGWDIGVDGMKVGGKRRLQIPAKLGYGSSGAPPTIPPNADLVFDVECKFVS